MRVEIRYEAEASIDELKAAILKSIQCRLRQWERDVEEAFEDECQFMEFVSERDGDAVDSNEWLEHLVSGNSPF